MSKNPTRMEQLGNLLTAMIAVIVSGSSDLLITPPIPIHPIFENPPSGIYSRVARQLSISASCVRQVALGKMKCKRVADALIAEASVCAPKKLPYPYGTFSKMARQLGVTPQHVRHIAIGTHRSKRVSDALNAEMRRLDEQGGAQ